IDCVPERPPPDRILPPSITTAPPSLMPYATISAAWTDLRRDRKKGAVQRRDRLSGDRDDARAARDGVSCRPLTRGAADRAAGDRSLPRRPHAGPLRRAARERDRRVPPPRGGPLKGTLSAALPAAPAGSV